MMITKLTRGDLVELFLSAIDPPLHRLCRSVSCSTLFYAAAVLDRVDDALDRLERWYSYRAPQWLRTPAVASALVRARDKATTAWLATNDTWRAVTDYWKRVGEPTPFADVLATYRRIVGQHHGTVHWNGVLRVA